MDWILNVKIFCKLAGSKQTGQFTLSLRDLGISVTKTVNVTSVDPTYTFTVYLSKVRNYSLFGQIFGFKLISILTDTHRPNIIQLLACI